MFCSCCVIGGTVQVRRITILLTWLMTLSGDQLFPMR